MKQLHLGKRYHVYNVVTRGNNYDRHYLGTVRAWDCDHAQQLAHDMGGNHVSTGH